MVLFLFSNVIYVFLLLCLYFTISIFIDVYMVLFLFYNVIYIFLLL